MVKRLNELKKIDMISKTIIFDVMMGEMENEFTMVVTVVIESFLLCFDCVL